MDPTVADFDNLSSERLPAPTGYTRFRSPTFISSGNPCLDFFFHVIPNTPPNTLIQRLQLAWSHNPLTTLKLLCNLRGGAGMSDKEGLYAAVLWLHNHHPKTLASNIPHLAEFGYLEDLPEILYRLLEGPEAREATGKQQQQKNKEKESAAIPKAKKLAGNKEKENVVVVNANKFSILSAIDDEERKKEEKRLALNKKLLDRYKSDPNFKSLHDRVSNHFAERLKRDMGFLNSGSVSKISLAARWCPSVDSYSDQSTQLCESVAKRLFPREEEADYACSVDRLRKEVLVPLREATTAAGALLPHEIIKSLGDGEGREVAELHWKTMVDDLLIKKGKLKNCIAVCDVSESMNGTPMQVSLALGMLVSELSEEPWKGKVITFSESPQLHLIEGNDLWSKTKFMKKMDWGGMSQNFQKVFDIILEVAVNGKLKEDQMIKRVFVFSDMEFGDYGMKFGDFGDYSMEFGDFGDQSRYFHTIYSRPPLFHLVHISHLPNQL